MCKAKDGPMYVNLMNCPPQTFESSCTTAGFFQHIHLIDNDQTILAMNKWALELDSSIR